MGDLLLNSYEIVYLSSEVITTIFAAILLTLSLKLLFGWDINRSTKEQYNLEKVAYLASTLALFLFWVKTILYIYLVYTLDELSIYIAGAMCAAGVVSANSYGLWLLGIKAISLFLLLLWMVLNSYDLEQKNYPIFKKKIVLLIFISLFILLEGWLNYSYIVNIDRSLPVSCCSTLFGNLEGENPLPFNLNTISLIILFFLLFIAFELSLLIDSKLTTLVVTPLFLVLSYYSVVYFFGTYIYEVPTHNCPFCMMQKEYNYVGYILWGTLFFGTSFAIIWASVALWLKQEYRVLKKLALILIAIFVALNSSYFVLYYIKNGVLL